MPRTRTNFKAPMSDINKIKTLLYRNDPVAFVQMELGETPSEYQQEVLRDCVNPDNKKFIISAGRGAGKTKLVSWIVAWSEACLQDKYPKYECIILGGTQDQSRIMYAYFKNYLERTPLLYERLAGEPTVSFTPLDKGFVRAVPCSDAQVRGNHPELLVLDEIAGIDNDIVESALPMSYASHHGRVIMLSTPHKAHGIFQDYWDNAELYGFKRYGPWSLENTPWINKQELELAKLSYSKEKYDVEFRGMFSKVGGRAFNADKITACTYKEPFVINPSYNCDAGVDWGRNNPTVLVRAQRIGNKVWIPGPEMSWSETDYPIINNTIGEYCLAHRVKTIFADSSHRGENERLSDRGIDCLPIVFSKDSKALMIEMTARMIYEGTLVISPDQETLIKQLKKYRFKEVTGIEGKTMGVKKDEDHVDALMLSLWNWVEQGSVQQKAEKILTF